MRPSLVLVCSTASFLAALVLGCGGGGQATSSATSTSSSSGGTAGAGGTGGSAPTCEAVQCTEPGAICQDGACVVDCKKPGASPCEGGAYCDVSDASSGQCVAIGSPCLTTSAPEPCGDRVCGPGSVCDGAAQCYPRVPCKEVACDDQGCWGTQCACNRAIGLLARAARRAR